MDTSLQKAWQRLPNLFRILLFIGVVLLISLLFPNDLKFKYEFERQQTWRYEDLVAPFDFAIRKTEEELEEERQLVLETLTPVYELDGSIARQRKESFVLAFNQQLNLAEESNQFRDVTRNKQRYLEYALSFMDRIFQRGIILPATDHRDKEKDFVVTLIKGNTKQEQTLENILDLPAAREMLSDSLPYSRLREPEFIYPLMEEELQANLFYSDTLTAQLREEALSQIVTSQGLVRKGELIVQEGGVVTDDIYQTLVSYREKYEEEVSSQKSQLGVYLGYLLLTSIIILAFGIYLRFYASYVYTRYPKLVFIVMWLVLYSYLVYLIEGVESLNTYLIPFCIAPIIIKTFFNEQLALFTHIVIVLIASFLSALGYEFTFLQLLAGIVVMLSNIDTRNWTRFFYSLLFIFLAYALGHLGLSLIKEGNLQDVDWTIYTWIFLNVFLTLLAYPLIPLMERLFGFVSPITLVELSDMNRPLLRELALKAPGTLQHSLQVGNLSEAAARRIGADQLLVKVAALYHDVGKTQAPAFFIENNSGTSPHESKTNLESAQIIINHVTEGAKMAKKAGLPQLLIDFIQTHHGNTRVEYFYRNYLKEHPDKEVDEYLFRYPGPRPRSKEEAILMMADSIEAACKSLKNPTQAELFGLIDKIIQGKVSSGQLEDSEISFRELEECKEEFRKIMKSVYHLRIEYPKEEEE